MSGNTASRAKEVTSAGERMPLSDSIWSSWAPAFTYTAVPASMPTWLTQQNVHSDSGVTDIARLTAKNGNAGTSRSANR